MESQDIEEQTADHQEDISILWKAVCFLFPIVGIIIYFVQKNKGELLKSKSALTAAVAGMILNILILLTQNYL